MITLWIELLVKYSNTLEFWKEACAQEHSVESGDPVLPLPSAIKLLASTQE